MKWKSYVIILSFLLIILINTHAQEGRNERRQGDKRGTCPRPGYGICADLCSSDRDCPRREKCCYNGCGHDCMDPVSEVIKPGRCPKTGYGRCSDRCSSDGDCPGREKCCTYGCRHICTTPEIEVIKPGRCPKTGYGRCSDRCSSDGDCPGREKCCTYGCRHICTAPEIEDVCQLPKEVGHCDSRARRYYFNEKSNRCRSFYYSGCGGNENNFSSRRSCQQRCERRNYYKND
ncbi:hypothetical protein CHS0354_037685 [Potamilus streckersoni]|uniref:Uncharacterized protein n=1 Tax=Potamilus streckersoni TaxID=2493646 RepID=A0AAE0T098_9BIVA|nr:hypothetical protein CHS0354_037685 [Potamilus streckersoni]